MHTLLNNQFLKENWNSNLLKILVKCKRYANQRIKIEESYTEIIKQSKGNRQGGIIETLEFIF